MLKEMGHSQFIDWVAFFELEEEDRKKAENKSKGNTQSLV